MNAREAAFLAYLQFLKDDTFIQKSLNEWQKRESPSHEDAALASQIAYGTVQRSISLDYFAKQLSSQQKLSLKNKEKALLRTALYQYYFLDKIPLYAIADEMQKIAKKYCHYTFCSFLNALLRKIEKTPLELPPDDLSIAYSYPLFFVKKLLEEYPIHTVHTILKAGNAPAKITARKRPSLEMIEILPSEIDTISQSEHFYIQNKTPVLLVEAISKSLAQVSSILDLCASPGGKLLAFHDLFPDAHLFANDVTEEKLQRLKENCEKYGVEATLSCSPGESFKSDHLFDLIILDVPCSNSGVLNKRKEARHRLSQENLDTLVKMQKKLVTHAISLLKPHGKIAYMTCSILKEENRVTHESLHIISEKLILPSMEGLDGGYMALLEVKHV